MSGATVAIDGNIGAFRGQDTDQDWVIKYPKVLLEFLYSGSVEYTINSSTVGVSAADDQSVKGVFNGSLEITQQGGYVSGYKIRATAYNSSNVKTNLTTANAINVVKP